MCKNKCDSSNLFCFFFLGLNQAADWFFVCLCLLCTGFWNYSSPAFQLNRYCCMCTASWHLPHRRTQCLPGFRATHCGSKGDQAFHIACKEDSFCGGAWLYHGYIFGWQSYCVWGRTFNRLCGQYSPKPADRDEFVSFGKFVELVKIKDSIVAIYK